jgi:hypothetical protein
MKEKFRSGRIGRAEYMARNVTTSIIAPVVTRYTLGKCRGANE